MALDLARIGGGFNSPVLASQRVFRQALAALSQPGTVIQVSCDASLPRAMHPAALALALSLLDSDTRLWLSAGLAGAADFLRFHTGCGLVQEHEGADFALLASPAELPPLASFTQGSERYPDRSATLILQVPWLAQEGTADRGWSLSGPGIRDTARLTVEGLGEEFLVQWAHNARAFPCGVDLFLASGEHLAALPRSTRVEA